MSPYFGEILSARSVLLVCDLQERFGPSVLHFDAVVENASRLVRAAKVAGVPVMATEQYPKGLGRTVPSVRDQLEDGDFVSKTKFSMCVPEIESRLEDLDGRDTVILCGLETHVCVVATCQDLRRKGKQVHVVSDACTSRTQTDRHFALDRMRQIGAFVNTTESVVLALAADASDPNFKELQAIIRPLNQDTGLLPPAPRPSL